MNPLQQRSFALGLLLCLAAAFVLQHSDSTLADTQSVGPARLTLPVISPVTMVRGFQAPLTEYGPGHRGIDLATTDGAVLLAPSSGTVSFVGTVNLKPEVTVTSSSGLKLTLEPACSALSVGSPVTIGQLVGSVCAGEYLSHCAPALCLHFSARNNDGYLSPQFLLGQLGFSHLVR